MDRTFAGKLFATAIGAAALACAASTAEAFTESNGNNVQIQLTSTVNNICSISTSTTGAVVLGDVTVTPFNGTIATLTELCNALGGYKVTLTSLNAGNGNTLFLKPSSATNTEQINYSLTYGTAPVSFSGGSATLTTSHTPTGGTGVQNPLSLTTVTGFYNADTYTDTLTITLAAGG